MAIRKINGVELVKVTSVDRLSPDTADTIERGFEVPIAVGTNPSVLDISFPFEWEPEAAKAIVDHAEYDAGDRVYAYGAKPTDPFLGVTAAAAADSQKRVQIEEALFKLLKPGHVISFASDTGIFLIDDLDNDAMEIILDRDLDVAITQGEGVKVRVPFLHNVRPLNGVIESFGELSPGARHIEKNGILRIEYHHKTDPTQVGSMHLRMVYKY